MSTTAAPNLAQPPVCEEYPDDPLRSNSPGLEPVHPMLQPSPPRPPALPASVSSPPHRGNKSNRPRKTRPVQSDALLLSTLDNFRQAGSSYHAIVSGSSEAEEVDGSEFSGASSCCDASPVEQSADGGKDRRGLSEPRGGEAGDPRMRSGFAPEEDIGAFDLKGLRCLAAGALAAFAGPTQPEPDAGPTPPVAENDVVGGRAQPAPPPSMAAHTRRTEPPTSDDRNLAHALPSPYSPGSLHSPREQGREQGRTPLPIKVEVKSPTTSIRSSSHSDGLPPILNSPRETHTLPSIRSQLPPDFPLDGTGLRAPSLGFPGSPHALPSLASFHIASPPLPPAEPYRDPLPLSPVHPLATPTLSAGFYYAQANGHHRPHDYASTSPEMPGSHPSCSPPGLDRMSIDGMTIGPTGSYVCKVPGCTAQPFQTQYLLNSHANVHSSARPHYCPVPGCARGEGGKGFKRKNEMIRHGLVHESPGYVCPFCPDRDHRYPRPDNLQR